MNERSRRVGHMSLLFGLLLASGAGARLGAPHGAPLGLGDPLLAQETSAVPTRIALAQADPSGSASVVREFDESAGRICRRSLLDDSTTARAAVALMLVLPDASWNAVQLLRLPSDVAPSAHAAVSTIGEEDPMIYWRPPLRASELLHELVHAWQAAQSDDVFATLLGRLADRDARGGFDADVVDQATSSVMLSLTLYSGNESTRIRQLVDHVVRVKAGDPGSLARRADSLIAAVSGAEWRDTRRQLARGLSTRSADSEPGRTWAEWLRALMLTEAQAYDAQARCENGAHVRDWLPDAVIQPTARALAASSHPRTDRGVLGPPR